MPPQPCISLGQKSLPYQLDGTSIHDLNGESCSSPVSWNISSYHHAPLKSNEHVSVACWNTIPRSCAGFTHDIALCWNSVIYILFNSPGEQPYLKLDTRKRIERSGTRLRC